MSEGAADRSTFFELLGGVETIRKLVERFYDVMDNDPRAATIRAMHQPDLSAAREKLFMYLTGWTGGPQLYVERYGHPMLRARHLPFMIGENERDEWMYCIIRAMYDIGIEEKLIIQLADALWELADHMRNKEE